MTETKIYNATNATLSYEKYVHIIIPSLFEDT